MAASFLTLTHLLPALRLWRGDKRERRKKREREREMLSFFTRLFLSVSPQVSVWMRNTRLLSSPSFSLPLFISPSHHLFLSPPHSSSFNSALTSSSSPSSSHFLSSFLFSSCSSFLPLEFLFSFFLTFLSSVSFFL